MFVSRLFFRSAFPQKTAVLIFGSFMCITQAKLSKFLVCCVRILFFRIFFQWSYPDYGNHQQVRYTIYYAQMGGLLLGLVVGSFLSDYFGRRRVMFAAYSAMCFFQSCTAISESWEGFFVTQSLVGVFAGTIVSIAF